MDSGEEAAHGHGEEDDEGPSTPWLPPDDRLWRHPSEVRSNPPAPPPPSGVRGWYRRPGSHLWLVGSTSGVVGALLCAGILIAAGAVDRSPPPVTNVSATGVSQGTTPSTGGSTPSAPAVYDSVEPSVVGLTVTTDSATNYGSGVVVLSSGPTCYVLTDYSLVAGATSSTVVVNSYLGEQVNGQLVGTDQSEGIAVIKANLCVRTGRYPAVTAANPGTVANLQTGEQVFAIGSTAIAADQNGTAFTPGFMDDATSYLGPVNGSSNAMFSLLTANVSIDQSAYGGALVDSTGALIGITNQVPPGQSKPGLVYITPIDLAMVDVPAIIKNGQPAAHAWLGVLQETDISPPAAQGLKCPSCIEVQNMSTGSPAAKAGIVDNDVITAIDGSNGNVSSVGAFVAWMATTKPGQVVNINWLHNGEPRQGHVTLGTQPAVADPS